jgi:TetR/AcrR family tetracycline transcriptional repressor
MPLDRKAVVASALELLGEVGLEGLTLRRLADKLKVQAPAIYWHFKHKQDLLDEMATTVLRTQSRLLRAESKMRWDTWSLYYGKAMRRMLLQYRDGARMVSGTRVTDDSIYASMQASIQRLLNSGFTSYQSLVALATIYSYVVGFVIEEQAVFPREGEKDEAYKPEIRSQRIDPQKFPLALEAGAYLFSNFDRRFDHGLKLIIAGLAAQRKNMT